MSFLKKLAKTGNVGGQQLSTSDLFKEDQYITTPVPIINLAFSGSLDKGFGPGLHTLAGPSKHYKSNLGLVMVKSFQDKYPEGNVIFYDSEQGATPAYFETFGIDQERVLHVPIMNIEELKFDISQKLEMINEETTAAKKAKEEPPRVFIFIDSMGNLASKKEVEDAVNEKSVADMTRAKAAKSLWRIVTPYLKKLDIPCVIIQHTYQEIGMFPKTIVGGGCVVAGTQVRMADGNTKAIEDIRVDELVATAAGTFKVTHTWDPETLEEGHPECYEITFEDGTVETISYNDHLMIDGKMVQVQDIKAGDLIDIYK